MQTNLTLCSYVAKVTTEIYTTCILPQYKTINILHELINAGVKVTKLALISSALATS